MTVSNSAALLEAFLSAKQIEGCSPKTLRYYRETIERMVQATEKPITGMTTDDIRGYPANFQKERKVTNVTLNNIRRIFSSFFTWLEDEEHINKNPTRRIKNIKTDKTIKAALTDEEIEMLRNACTHKRNLAILDLLSSTGIRAGELIQINRSDLDFNERECIVLGKGNKERIVYFDGRTKISLMSYLAGRVDDNPALFVSLSRPFKRLEQGGLLTMLRDIGNSTGITQVHPHKFRRTFVTRAIDKGMPIEQVQNILGHVRIDTTMHYALVNQENVKNSHRKYIG